MKVALAAGPPLFRMLQVRSLARMGLRYPWARLCVRGRVLTMGKIRDRRRREIADLRRKLAVAARQLDRLEARLRDRSSMAVGSRGGEETCRLSVDTETRFASLIALGLSRLSSRVG